MALTVGWFSLPFLHDVVEEDDDDGCWCHIADAEQQRFDHAHAARAVIGEFGGYHAAVELPAHEVTEEDAAQGQQHVGRHIVEQLEDGHSPQRAVRQWPERQRTQRAAHDGDGRVEHRGTIARHVPLLVEKGDGNFAHRDGRRDGSHKEQEKECHCP